MSLKFVLALAPHLTFTRHAVGDFVSLTVNGRKRWCYKSRVFELPAELADYNAAALKLALSPFAIQNGGVFALMLETSTAPAPVAPALESLPRQVPQTFAEALASLPFILSADEQAGVLKHAQERTEAINQAEAVAKQPTILEVPEVVETEAKPEPVTVLEALKAVPETTEAVEVPETTEAPEPVVEPAAAMEVPEITEAAAPAAKKSAKKK